MASPLELRRRILLNNISKNLWIFGDKEVIGSQNVAISLPVGFYRMSAAITPANLTAKFAFRFIDEYGFEVSDWCEIEGSQNDELHSTTFILSAPSAYVTLYAGDGTVITSDTAAWNSICLNKLS